MSKPATASREALRGLIAFALVLVAVFVAAAFYIGGSQIIAVLVVGLGVAAGALIWRDRS